MKKQTDFEWIREAITEAAKRYPDVTPAQVELESRLLINLAQYYLDDLASGIFTPEEIAADISKYKDKAKEALLGYSTKANDWKDGSRNGKFTLECHALVLAKLEAVFLGMKQEEEGKRERLELAQRLAKEILKERPQTEMVGDERVFRWVYFPVLEKAFRDFTRLREDASSEAAFREKLRAKLAALKAEIDEKYKLVNPEDAQPFRGAAGLPKDFHKEQQKERKDYLTALFKNTLLAKYLTALFPEEGLKAGEGQPGQPEGQPFGEELERVVRAALEKRGLLNANGHFKRTDDEKGKDFRYTQVKALFVVLRQREYLPKKSKSRAAEILAALFASQFNFDFSPRTVTSAEKEKNAGQDKEETEFLGAIPARK